MATNKNNISNRAANTARNHSIMATMAKVKKAGAAIPRKKKEEERAKTTAQPTRSLRDTFTDIAHQVDNAYNTGSYLQARENRQAEEQQRTKSVMDSWNEYLNKAITMKQNAQTPTPAMQNNVVRTNPFPTVKRKLYESFLSGELEKKASEKEQQVKTVTDQWKNANKTAKQIGGRIRYANEGNNIGQFGKGNIDLYQRPKYQREDGSYSTVYSLSFHDSDEKKDILVPTIINGKEVTEDEAIDHYYKTGEYLGKFDTAEEADEYAQKLHDQQAKLYGEGPKYQPHNTEAKNVQKIYGNLKDQGQGAGSAVIGGITGELTKEKRDTYNQSVSIGAHNSQFAETINTLGSRDSEEGLENWQYSPKKNRELESAYKENADFFEDKFKNFDNFDFLTNPEGSAISDEEAADGAITQQVRRLLETGIRVYDENGDSIVLGGPNGTIPEDYDQNKEKYNQLAYAKIFGNHALEEELRKNNGVLSAEYSEEMEQVWDRIRYPQGDLKATADYYRQLEREAGSAAETYENYFGMMDDAESFTSRINNASGGFIPENENINFMSRFNNNAQSIYSFVNRGELYNQVAMGAETGGMSTEQALGNVFGGAAFMLSDEIELFNKMYNAGEYEAAGALIEGLKPSLALRRSQWQESNAKLFSDQYPLLAEATAVVTNKAAGIQSFVDAMLTIAGAKQGDANDNMEYYARWTKTVRDNLVENVYNKVYDLTKNEFIADIAKSLKQTGFSIEDFTTDAALGSGFAALAGAKTAQAAASIAKGISLGFMGSEVFGSVYYDTMKETNDPVYSGIMAFLNAGVELLTETLMGMDDVFDFSKHGWRYVLGSILGETGEEAESGILSPLAESALNMVYGYLSKGERGMSVWDQDAMNLVRENPKEYTYKDKNGNMVVDAGKAKKEAMRQFNKELGWEVVGGAAGGLGGAMIAYPSMHRSERMTGKTIRNAEAVSDDTYTEGEQAGQKKSNEDYLVDIALGMNPETESNQLAQEMKRQKSAGKKIGTVQLGRLAQAISSETNEKVAKAVEMSLGNSVREQIDQELPDKTNEEKQRMADVVAKATARGLNSLTKEERTVLTTSQTALDMYRNMVFDKKATDKHKEFAETAIGKADQVKNESGVDVLDNLRKMTDTLYNKASKAIRIVTGKNAKSAAERAVANGATKLMEVGEGGRTSGTTREVFVGGEAAEIVGVDTDGYKVKVNGEERTVAMDEVKAGNRVMAATMSFIELNKASLSDRMSNLLVQGAASGAVTEENVQDYLSGAYQIRVDAFLGKSAPTNTSLDPKLVEMIHTQSKADAAAIDAARTAPGKRINVNPGNGAVKLMGVDSTDTKAFEEELNKLDEGQCDQVRALAKVFKKIGVGVTFVKDAADRYGSYNIADGSVIINVAGEEANNEKHHLYVTAAHELTHWLESNAKEGYAALRDFVLKQIEASGQDLNTLVQRKQDQYNAQLEDMNKEGDLSYEPLTIDGAIAEIVADGCDQVLTNEETIQRLAEDNKGLYNKIKSFVTDFINLVRKGAAGINTSTSRYSRWVQDQNTLARLWNVAYEEATTGVTSQEGKEAGELNTPKAASLAETKMSLAERDESYIQAVENKDNKMAQPLTEDADGNALTVMLPGNTVAKGQFSLASWTESERKRVRADMIKAGFTEEEVDGWIQDVNSISALIAADKGRLDYEVTDPDKKFLKDNQDYEYTLDASTLCAKRLLYQGTFNAVQALLPNTPLMPEDLIDLYNLMKEKGYETPCGFCYVESRRRWLGKYASEWLEKYNGRYMPTLSEVTTSDGLEQLRKEHPEAYNSFQKAMKDKGSANPKVVQLRTEYRGDISRLTRKDIQKVKDIGGLRVQSFSDFEVPHLIDMMQAVIDMASMKLTSQAYTKVPEFAAVFGDTGIKINLSLVGKGTGLDANGNLVFDDVEGMPFRKAMVLRNRYSKNVGTILVGINDDHIVAAMGDDRIDYIIPFHQSGWSQTELKGISVLNEYEDYTSYQNERIITGKRESTNINYKNKRSVDSWIKWNGDKYPGYKVSKSSTGYTITVPGGYETESLATYNKRTKEGLKNFEPVGAHQYWDFSKSGEWNAENYLRMCAESHRMPKFSQFLTDNGDGTFSLPEGDDARSKAIRKGYWKTLVDFKMYDNAGKGAAQQEVAPNFNMYAAKKVMDTYTLDRTMPNGMKISKADNNTLPVADEVVEEYVRQYKEKHKDRTQFSLAEKYDSAVSKDDMEAARKALDDYAAGAGYTEKAYHGTDRFGFTRFDLDMSQDQIFVAYDDVLAGTYTSDRADVRNISSRDETVWDLDSDELYYYALENLKYIYKDGKKLLAKFHAKPAERGPLKWILQTKDPDEWLSDWKFEEISEAEVRTYVDRIYKNRGGIYELYTRPGRQLVIDANDTYWNSIKVPWGKPGDRWKTREIAAYAKDHGYDSVKIYNVMDDGGRSHRRTDGMDGYGDIGIFFNPTDVKSADTVTYDENGDVIPLSERFSTENDDIRWSMKELGSGNAAEWLEGLDENTLANREEQKLLKGYKEKIGAVRATRDKIAKMEKELETKKGDAARKIRINLETERNKLNRQTKELNAITDQEGFAKVMRTAQRVMDELISGKTQADVEARVTQLTERAEQLKKDAASAAEAAGKLGADADVKIIRSYFSKAGLTSMAREMKKLFKSNVNTTEIENSMAAASLKLISGDAEGFAADVEKLTKRLIDTGAEDFGGITTYYTDALSGQVFTLSSRQWAELKNMGYTKKAVRSLLAGTGIKFTEGTADGLMDRRLEELYALAPGLENEIGNLPSEDMPMRILQLIMNEKEGPGRREYSQEEFAASMAQVGSAVAELKPAAITDPKIAKVITNLTDYITELSEGAQSVAEQVKKLQESARTTATESRGIAGVTNRMNRNAGEAVKLARGQAAAAGESIRGETQKEIDTLKKDLRKAIDYYTALSNGEKARQIEEGVSKMRRLLQSQATLRVLDEQLYWKQRIENDKNVREAATERQKTKRQVARVYNRLAKLLLEETDEKNIPEGYKSIALAALKPILDQDSISYGKHITENDKQQKIRQGSVMSRIMTNIGANTDLSVIQDEDIRDKVEKALKDIEEGVREYGKSLKGRAIENLNAENAALKKVHEGIKVVNNLIQTARDLDLNGRRIAIADVAFEVDTDAKKRSVYKERIGPAGEKVNLAERKILWGNMTPEYFFKRLGNNGLNLIWNSFHQAEDRNGLLTQIFKEKIEKIAAENKYETWDQEKKIVLRTERKKVVELTAEQAMSLYATYKRERALGLENSHHLETGGFILEQEAEKMYERKAAENVPVKFSESDFAELEKKMTEQQKAYADAWVELMSTEGSQLGNDTSMRMYGIKKYNEKYYFPFSVWDGVKNKASNSGSTINPTNNNRAAHQGFTNRIKTNAGNAVLIRNFTDVCVDHINQMITYSTMAPSIEAMNKVLNYKVKEKEGNDKKDITIRNIETILTERYGKNAVDYLRTLLQDLNGGVTQDRRTSMVEPLMSVFKKNAVGGSLSVALQQPLSYIRAATMISPKYLAEALNPTYYKGSLEEMRRHSGVAVIKGMGRFDMNYGRSAKEYLTPDKAKSKARAAYDMAVDKANALPTLMDDATWTRMWTACKLETAARNPGMDMGSEEFLNKVAERFNDLMRKTQVYDSILVKSSNMRSTAWTARVITAFKAEPTLTANMLMDAWRNRKTKGGRKALGGALAVYYLSAILQAAIKGIVGAGRTPDEKKTLAENWANKFAYNFIGEANPIALIPGYSEIVDALSGNEVKDNAYGVISNIYKSLTTARDVLQGNGNGTWRDLEDTAGQLTQIVSGIPLKNLMRDTRAIYNWALGSYANRARTETDEEGNERIVAGRATSGAVIKYQTRDTILTNDLIGAINKMLGTAGAKTNNDAYYGMIYNAEKKGNAGRADELKEYLLSGKGVKDSSLKTGVAGAAKKDPNATAAETAEYLLGGGYTDRTNYLTEQYKAGELTDAEFTELYEKYFPEAKTSAEDKLIDMAQDMYKDGKLDEAQLKEKYSKYSTEEKYNKYLYKDVDQQYMDGEITRKEAEEAYKKKYPKADANSVWLHFDRIDYEMETGRETSGDYYRVHDAIEGNRSADITREVEKVMKHGKTKNGVKSSIESNWKEKYLEMRDGSAEKVRLKDGIIKAMKAAGYTASQAENMIRKWKK